MAREQSIPEDLHGDVVRRYTMGRRPGQIAKWLKEKHDVSTTRSSVNRLIDKVLEGHAGQQHIATVNRIRVRAARAQAEFERAGRELWKSVGEMQPGMAPEDLKVCLGRTLALSRISLHCQRALRGAGVIGRPAVEALEEWKDELDEMRDDLEGVPESDRLKRDNPATQAEDEPVTASPEEVLSNDPAVLQSASDAGRLMSACMIAAMPVHPEDPLPPSASFPLTPWERSFREAFVKSWRAQLELGGGVVPEESKLRDRLTEEIQFCKRRLQLGQTLNEVASTELIVERTYLTLDARVPAPHDATRETREAYRLGDLWLPIVLELDGVPLTPRERAWCAGAGHRDLLEGAGEDRSRERLRECIATMETVVLREKSKCLDRGDTGTRIVSVPIWEEPEVAREAA